MDDKTIPEDLRVFRDNLANRGIRVRLPSAGPDFQLPDPIPLKGVSLGDTVVQMRREAPF